MRWTTATLALLGFLALCTADDKTDPKVQPVRELIVKDLKIGKVKAKLDEPAKVTNAEELAKLVADKDEAAKIAKEIDFAKEYLIVFAWEGSGQDRLDHAIKAEKDDPASRSLTSPAAPATCGSTFTCMWLRNNDPTEG